jgi:hypothetical protein
MGMRDNNLDSASPYKTARRQKNYMNPMDSTSTYDETANGIFIKMERE